MYTTLLHSAQLMIDSRSHDTAIWQTSQESEVERVPIVIRMSTCCFVCPGLLHARYTDVFYTCRYTDGGFGCRSRYGARSGEILCFVYTMVIKTELWTSVHSPVVRAADCRSAGPWFNSGWRLWIHTHWHVCRNNIMSPITTTITMPMTTMPRKSVNRNSKKHFKKGKVRTFSSCQYERRTRVVVVVACVLSAHFPARLYTDVHLQPTDDHDSD